jgi:polysaccharide pyruvyl transferase WcaK-like protein
VINPEFWSTREEGWVDRRKEWVSAFAELPVVGVRGPISKALLEDAGATNVTVCGDPAVAFHRRYVGKTRSRTHGNSLQVGINTGDCSGQLWGCQEDVQVALTAAACWLRESGHQIEIIPVWQKDVEACIELARNAGLDRATVTPVCYTHEAFLERVERLDLLICLKLHAGILAAAANVPFVSLEYQPKCHDFASSINWDEFSIRTDQLKPGKLIELVNGLMAQLEAKSEELCATLCKLMNNFEKYCAHIEPLLLRSN